MSGLADVGEDMDLACDDEEFLETGKIMELHSLSAASLNGTLVVIEGKVLSPSKLSHLKTIVITQ